jgi:ABC-type uncharacterized transport system ATPase subunit
LEAEFKGVFFMGNIKWFEWNGETQKEIAERAMPVLLFIYEPEEVPGIMHPFCREVLYHMESNQRLVELLNTDFISLKINSDKIPEYLSFLGAGKTYYLAILSPAGLTPLGTLDIVTGKPEEIAENLVKVFEKLKSTWV